MRKIVKKEGDLYMDLINTFQENIDEMTSFIYHQDVNKNPKSRFLSPVFCMYDSRTPALNALTKNRFRSALIEVIDLNYSVAGFKIDKNNYIIVVGRTREKLVNAVKHAKVLHGHYVVDLQNCKLHDVNG